MSSDQLDPLNIERGFPAERMIGERETSGSVVHNTSKIGNPKICLLAPPQPQLELFLHDFTEQYRIVSNIYGISSQCRSGLTHKITLINYTDILLKMKTCTLKADDNFNEIYVGLRRTSAPD